MQLIEVLPYIIEYVTNEEDFIRIQEKLFEKGYRWLDGAEVFTSYMITYPLYVSNLPFNDHRVKDVIRQTYNVFTNDILFFDDQPQPEAEHDFDMKVLRRSKLDKLNMLCE